MATNNDVIVVEDPANTVVSVARNKVTVVLSQALNDGNDVDTGFMRYEDAGYAQSVAANTWTTLTNNGAGAGTLKTYGPQNVGDMLNVATGEVDFSELSIGDTVIVAFDFTFTPTATNAVTEFQMLTGAGGAEIIPAQLTFLPSSGIAYRLAPAFIIPITDAAIQSNPGTFQLRSTSAGSVDMTSATLQLINRFG